MSARAVRRMRAWIAPLALAAVLGCGRDGAPPLAPAPLPPGVAEVFPAARASKVAFDVEPWARFETALDPATVNERTVFLKLDTRRIPVEVRWEAATNRIRIRPLEEPTIGRTHTVVLSTSIRTADGTPLAAAYEWQFRIVGLRLPQPRYPQAGAPAESPFAGPEWDGTETLAGAIEYALYAGTDSLAVAARALPPRRFVSAPYFLPDTAWAPGGRVWWAVSAINRTLGEQVDGPVSAFDVVPANTPVDSSGAAITQYGYRNSGGAGGCTVAQILCGPNYLTGVRWNTSAITGRRLAAVRVETNVSDSTVFVNLFAPDRAFNECTMRYPGPPFPDPVLPQLARSTRARGTRRLVFRSDLLTAYVERVLRRGDFAGFLFQSGRVVDLLIVNADPTPPLIRVVHYVVPPGPGPVAPASPASPASRAPARGASPLDPSLTSAAPRARRAAR